MIGQSLAHYEITAKLGQGGMGAVYRAHDTKLDRDVALKLLPDELSADVERLARFRREAKVLASLNHPNIAAIHGLEEDQGRVFLVMELADGEDLSQRLKRGAFSADELLPVARQLAEGLEQAHERGVVHRDLKPANVMLSEDGTIKILDFGLARAYAGKSAEEEELANSPTITAAMTQAGTILGTAAYMSPEQARGKEVDRRADIWAFGVMLFEMLSGQQLFAGETISDTLAGVLKTEPDLDSLPADTPVALRWLIDRCLQKQPSARLRDIGEARILLESDLDQLPASTMIGPGVVISERPRWVVPAMIAIAVLAAAVGSLVGMVMLTEIPTPTMIHASILAPPESQIDIQAGGHIALSPDGSRLAFAASDSAGTTHLWLRRIDSAAAHQLSGTKDASYPFWSFDGEKIGFFADGRLKKIDASGGVATAVCDAPSGRGGTWTRDGRILFAPGPRKEIHVVASGGGEPRAVTQNDSLEFSHRWPEILPDNVHYLYTILGDNRGVRWASLEDSTETRHYPDIIEGRYAAGHLIFGRDGALWARPFDPQTGDFKGEESLLAEAVITSDNFGGAVYSITDDGTLVFAAGERASENRIGIYDLEGKELENFPIDAGFADDISLSADGRYLAMTLYPTEGDSDPDIWIRDLKRKTLSRLTTDENVDDPIWAPTQDRIVYSQEGDLYVRSTVGARGIIQEIPMEGDAIPHAWSSDGENLLVSRPGNGRSIWIIPLDASDEARVLVDDTHFNVHPDFSPDGEWITYMSLETGDARVYVRDVRESGGTWQVTSSQSSEPRFTPDASSLYYLTESHLAAVDIQWTDRGPEFGAERVVAEIPVRRGRQLTHQWCLSPDGTQIVAFVEDRDRLGGSTPLELVVGWPQLVAEK